MVVSDETKGDVRVTDKEATKGGKGVAAQPRRFRFCLGQAHPFVASLSNSWPARP